jgi:hypothetical protein
MRMTLAKIQLVIAVPFLSALAMTTALGGQGYSFEEQEACTSDAFRFCSEFIPDIPRITTCMQAKRDQLSPRCAKMFAPDRDRHLNDPDQRPRDAEQQSHNQLQPRVPSQKRDADDPLADKPFE